MEPSLIAAEYQRVIDGSKSQNIRYIPIIQLLFLVIGVYSASMSGLLNSIAATNYSTFQVIYTSLIVIPLIIMVGLGYLTDTRGRKTMLITCEFLAEITILVPILAPSVGLNLGPLSWVLMGIGSSLSVSVIIVLQSMAADSTQLQGRTRIFGLLLALSVTRSIWSLIPYYLASLGYISLNLFPLAVVISFAAIIYITQLKIHETYVPDRQVLPSLKQRTTKFFKTLIRPQILILFLLIAAQTVFITVFTGYLSLFKLSRTGQLLGLEAFAPDIVIIIVEIIFVGRLSRWLGDRRLAYWGLTLLLIGILLFIATPTQAVPGYVKADMIRLDIARDNQGSITASVPLPLDENNGWSALIWFYAATIIISMAAGLLTPPLYSLLTQQTHSSDWGKLLGISTMLALTLPSFFPRPIAALTVMDNPAMPFIISAGIFAVLLAIAIFALPHLKGEVVAKMGM